MSAPQWSGPPGESQTLRDTPLGPEGIRQYNIVFPLWTRSQAGVLTSTITASSNSSPVTREVKRLGLSPLLKSEAVNSRLGLGGKTKQTSREKFPISSAPSAHP